ncbi:hypothetical protein JCM10207_004110 [Rhodosporidiobolus poonsookiae]
MTRTLPFHTVDAFSPRPFGGNPAAVIVFSEDAAEQQLAADDALLQKIAAEFNLSETAFARKLAGQGSEEEPVYELRWMTPTNEVPLCGHATLATAHTLFSKHHPSASSIRFTTRFSGDLYAVRASSGLIALDFPAASTLTLSEGHRRLPKIVQAVREATGLAEEQIRRVDWWDAFEGAIVELSAEVELEKLSVKAKELGTIGKLITLTVPAPASSGYDIYSRVFAPLLGIDEDPVTGAAHTGLAPFWLAPSSAANLANPTKARQTRMLRAKQVSRRGGEMEVVLSTDGKRVELRGQAKTVMRGEIELE